MTQQAEPNLATRKRASWEAIGPNVALVMKVCDLTQEAVAQGIGASRPGLHHWLSGKRIVPGDKADALAELLGVPLDVLKGSRDEVLRYLAENEVRTLVRMACFAAA